MMRRSTLFGSVGGLAGLLVISLLWPAVVYVVIAAVSPLSVVPNEGREYALIGAMWLVVLVGSVVAAKRNPPPPFEEQLRREGYDPDRRRGL